MSENNNQGEKNTGAKKETIINKKITKESSVQKNLFGTTVKAVMNKKSSDVDKRNYLNELNNKEWMFFTRSVWATTYPSEYSHALRKKQGGNKPPSLMVEILRFFTKSGDKVLDPMNGVGSTLIACALTGRKGTGIEINPEWIEIYNEVCNENELEKFNVIQGDALEEIDNFKPKSIDFVTFDPPYRADTKWNRTMCNDTHESRNAKIGETYSDSDMDLGNLLDPEIYLGKIRELCSKIYRILKDKKYLVVFTKDEYQEGQYQEVSSILADAIKSCGFKWKGKISWYQHGAFLRPYGVPYSYVPNLIDQKILIFRKET